LIKSESWLIPDSPWSEGYLGLYRQHQEANQLEIELFVSVPGCDDKIEYIYSYRKGVLYLTYQTSTCPQENRKAVYYSRLHFTDLSLPSLRNIILDNSVVKPMNNRNKRLAGTLIDSGLEGKGNTIYYTSDAVPLELFHEQLAGKTVWQFGLNGIRYYFIDNLLIRAYAYSDDPTGEPMEQAIDIYGITLDTYFLILGDLRFLQCLNCNVIYEANGYSQSLLMQYIDPQSFMFSESAKQIIARNTAFSLDSIQSIKSLDITSVQKQEIGSRFDLIYANGSCLLIREHQINNDKLVLHPCWSPIHEENFEQDYNGEKGPDIDEEQDWDFDNDSGNW